MRKRDEAERERETGNRQNEDREETERDERNREKTRQRLRDRDQTNETCSKVTIPRLGCKTLVER